MILSSAIITFSCSGLDIQTHEIFWLLDRKFYLELVIHSKILLPVKVSHGDLQLVISLAGQSVEVVKAKPALSLKNIQTMH